MHIISIHKGSYAIVVIHERKNINTNSKGTKTFLCSSAFSDTQEWKKKKTAITREEKKKSVRGGIRTHAHIRGPECFELALASKEGILESGALDHSATLTARLENAQIPL